MKNYKVLYGFVALTLTTIVLAVAGFIIFKVFSPDTRKITSAGATIFNLSPAAQPQSSNDQTQKVDTVIPKSTDIQLAETLGTYSRTNYFNAQENEVATLEDQQQPVAQLSPELLKQYEEMIIFARQALQSQAVKNAAQTIVGAVKNTLLAFIQELNSHLNQFQKEKVKKLFAIAQRLINKVKESVKLLEQNPKMFVEQLMSEPEVVENYQEFYYFMQAMTQDLAQKMVQDKAQAEQTQEKVFNSLVQMLSEFVQEAQALIK
jgi:hypothetical protein